MCPVFRLRPSDFFLSSCTSIETSLARTNSVPRRPDFRWIRLKIYTGRGSTEMLELARRFFLLLGVCYASLSCNVFTTVRIIVIISQNRRTFLVFPWRPVMRYEFRRCTENRRQDRNYQLGSPQNPKFFSDWTMINKNVLMQVFGRYQRHGGFITTPVFVILGDSWTVKS